MIQSQEEPKLVSCAIIYKDKSIYEISFDCKDAPGMALRALASFRQYHEFEVNEVQKKKIISLSGLKKWNELFTYLLEEGFIKTSFKRCE